MSKKIQTIVAGAAIAAAGIVATPSGQQVTQNVIDNSTKVVQSQKQQQRVNQRGQQAQRAAAQQVRGSVNAVYTPFNGGRVYDKGKGVPPRVYGEWPMRTGKDKYNHRKAKLLARALG